ncbi:MAG: MFS transporter [Oscillospiraceae bacterium]|nr:MFS transporter [Oscillospiraceae bacterium]
MSIKNNSRHTIFACYGGYITQAIVNNFAPLLFLIFRDRFGLPLEQITLLVTINFLVQLAVDLVAAKVADRIGWRRCLVAAHIFAAAGLAGLSLFPNIMPPFAGLLTSVVLYAVGGGLIEVLVSPVVEACPTENKAGVMSLLHSFYCWGTVGVVALSTLFLSVFGKDSWQILALCWAVFPLLVSVYFTQVPIYSLTEEGESYGIRQLCGMKSFWLFVVLMFAAGASEQAMSQWASAFAESGLGISKTIGDLLGPCLFSVLMGSSRVFYGKMSEKINLNSFLILSGVLCIGSYLLASLSPFPILSLVGCGLCGLSVGILWPGVFSLAAAEIPKGGTAMFALLALAGDLGCSGGPTTVGMLTGLFDGELKPALLFGIVFPMIMIVGALIQRKDSKNRLK